MIKNENVVNKMIFWGATGQAKVVGECLKESNKRLVALFDNNVNLKSPFAKIPLYYKKMGFQEWIKKQKLNEKIYFVVTIGGDNGKDRIEIHNYLEFHGLIPFIVKHHSAIIADDVKIGLGSQLLASSTVCVETIIGRGCIINTGAIVDHECIIGDGVHICPGAHLAGCVEIGRYSTIGTGAVVLPRVKIGERVVVGAGTVVLKDIPSYTVVVGNPARILKKLPKEL
ncbi:acetyltransferase [Desulfobacca acetoxidans]